MATSAADRMRQYRARLRKLGKTRVSDANPLETVSRWRCEVVPCLYKRTRMLTLDNVRFWLCQQHYDAYQVGRLEVVITNGQHWLNDTTNTEGW